MKRRRKFPNKKADKALPEPSDVSSQSPESIPVSAHSAPRMSRPHSTVRHMHPPVSGLMSAPVNAKTHALTTHLPSVVSPPAILSDMPEQYKTKKLPLPKSRFIFTIPKSRIPLLIGLYFIFYISLILIKLVTDTPNIQTVLSGQEPLFFIMLLILTALMLLALNLLWNTRLEQLNQKNIEDEIMQQRYRAIIDNSHGGMWEVNSQTNMVFISQALARLVGLPEIDTQLILPQFLNLFHEADREKLYAQLRRTYITGDFHLEVNVARLPITLALRGHTSVRGITDSTRIIIGFAIDITAERGAQKRLKAAESRLNDALRSMSDSFVIWDPLDRIVLWNDQFETYFGFEKNQIQAGMERAVFDRIASDHIAKIITTTSKTNYDIYFHNGRWVHYQETQTSDGGYVGTGTDITNIRNREHELKHNQQALEKTISVLRKSQVQIVKLAENYEMEKIRAEKAHKSKSAFLANMSHELRTPLNAINGFSDIMKKELFGPLGDTRYKEYVNDILFSGQHLLSLINEILDMSKIEAGKMKLHTQEIQLSTLITQVLRVVRNRAKEAQIQLIYNPVQLPHITADIRAVKQILLNLLTNAIKCTPNGGKVRIVTSDNSGTVTIKVIDNGIGISEKDLRRLAQPFEQVDNEHSRAQEGTGLGLALSKSLVELHGGQFIMESTLDVGTTMSFTLPNNPIEPPKDDPGDELQTEVTQLSKTISDILNAENGQGDAPTQPAE